MNDARWLAVLTVRQGEDRLESERVLSQIGYRGLTWHATKEEAKAAADQMLDAAVAAKPTLRWFAVWAKPYVGHLPNDEDSGTCYSATHEPASDG